jgi:hypothetical protein
MLQITQSALGLLQDALANERSDDAQVFRLVTQNQEFVLGIGEVEANDVEYETGGSTVLAASPEIAETVLGDATIDLQETPEGPKLMLTGIED